MYRDNDIMAIQAKQAEGAMCGTGQMRRPTMREGFIQRKADLTQQLANVDAALAALDENPNFEKILDVVQKVY